VKSRNKFYIFEKLNYLTSQERYEYYLLNFVFRHTARVTSYTKLMHTYFVKTQECNTQTRRKHDYKIPQMKTESGKKVHYYQAINKWNSLPIVIQESASFSEFYKNVSNLLVRCRENPYAYPNESRILNCYSIKSILE